MRTFYLMRHGQTRFNVQQRIQGASDSPLTELGIEQAKAAKHYFDQKGVVFDSIYTSTQERACDTAELASGRTDYVRLKGLKEQDFGAFEGQQEYLNPHLQGDIGYGDYFVTYGGESYLDVRCRMEKTIRQLLEAEKEPSTLLIVSHGAAIAQFYRQVIADYPRIRMTNCAILKFTYEKNHFDLLSVTDPVQDKKVYIKEEAH